MLKMPEDKIQLASEENMGELPFPTSDGIKEQLRQSEEINWWSLSMELALDSDDDDDDYY